MRKVLIIFSILFLVALTSSMCWADVRGKFVDLAFVKENVGKEACVIIDARKATVYNEGHIPGAINVGVLMNVDSIAAEYLLRDRTYRFLSPELYAALFGKIGINYDRKVIVYGERGDWHPAILNVILEYLDHDKTYYYDGGYEEWVEAKGVIDYKQPTPKKVAFKIRNVRADLYVTTEEVYNYVTKKSEKYSNITILDARSEEEYEGTVIPSLRGGHIPTAINKPVDSFLGKDGKVLPTDQLQKLCGDIPKGNKVVIYGQCGCHVGIPYLALSLLGYSVENYDESFIVWGNRVELPVDNLQWFHFKDVLTLEKRVQKLEKMVLKSNAKQEVPPSKQEDLLSKQIKQMQKTKECCPTTFKRSK